MVKKLIMFVLLTLEIESRSFILSFVICHALLFRIKKTSQVMQISGASLKVVETEIKATEKVLKKYRNNGYVNAVICMREMPSQIGS